MHCLTESQKFEMERGTNNTVKNDMKARSSPPRFKSRRKHHSGGNKKATANKVNKEESKFQTVSSEIGSSNNGTLLILRRSPTTNGDNNVCKPSISTTSDSPCPALAGNVVSQDGFDLTANQLQLLQDGKSYAGSRFHTPPRPDLLPKPPTHWISCNMAVARSLKTSGGFNQSLMNMHLKGLLKVQV